MSKYSPIWEALKKDGHVTLAVPVPLHKRVWKGVINCKDRDSMFKYVASCENKRYIITYETEGARIKIVLTAYAAIDMITAEDL